MSNLIALMYDLIVLMCEQIRKSPAFEKAQDFQISGLFTNPDRRTDLQTCHTKEMQFYISAMFLGLPDDIHKEKPSFSLQFKKRINDRLTDPVI